MLWLKRNTVWNQLMKCDVSNETIGPGDYYYIDDVDGTRVKFTVYRQMKLQEKRRNWDYSKLNEAHNEIEYKRRLREATRAILADTLLERKVAMKFDPNPGVESEIIEDVYAQNFEKNNGGPGYGEY